MALFEVPYSATATSFNVHSVSAGNPAELVTRLTAEIAAAVTAGEQSLVDFNLSGTGAGPNWEAWFTTSSIPTAPTISFNLRELTVVAAVAGNPTEARLALLADLAALSPAPTEVAKFEIAGGGIGTIFMAVAIVLAETGPTPTESVDLGTAGDFAIFAQSGITTTGGSTIDGDMGINPAAASAITGFALVLDASGEFSTSSQVFPGTPAAPYPVQLGHVFAPDYATPTPAKVVQASADLIAAYNDAAGRTPDFTAAGADIGGLTLEAGAAGVYAYTGASSVGVGTPLTLHGTNPGDAIIIQIAGTFDVHADILLTGTLAGHPENVYFAVAGQVTIFGSLTVNGEFLGATGIAMQAGTTLNGRALAQTAVTLINNTVVEA